MPDVRQPFTGGESPNEKSRSKCCGGGRAAPTCGMTAPGTTSSTCHKSPVQRAGATNGTKADQFALGALVSPSGIVLPGGQSDRGVRCCLVGDLAARDTSTFSRSDTGAMPRLAEVMIRPSRGLRGSKRLPAAGVDDIAQRLLRRMSLADLWHHIATDRVGLGLQLDAVCALGRPAEEVWSAPRQKRPFPCCVWLAGGQRVVPTCATRSGPSNRVDHTAALSSTPNQRPSQAP